MYKLERSARFISSAWTVYHVPRKTGSLSLVSVQYFSIRKRSFKEYLIWLIFKFATLLLFEYIIYLVVNSIVFTYISFFL